MYPGGTYGAAGAGGQNFGFKTGGAINCYGVGPIIAGGKIVYTLSVYGDAAVTQLFLVCLDEETGEHLWTTPMPPGLAFCPIVFYNHNAQYAGGLVITVYSGSALNVYDAETGLLVATWDFTKCKDWPGALSGPQIEWEKDILYKRMSGVVYGRLYGSRAVGREGKVYGFNITNPTLTADGSGIVKMWGPTDGFNTYPINGDVLIAWYPHNVMMTGIDKNTGKKLWEIPAQGFCRGAAGYGNFYHKAGDGSIWCIDMLTGNIEWKSEPAGTGYWTEHGCSIGNGVFIDGNYDGGVYCFDAFTKTQVGSFHGTHPIRTVQ
jgi:outer membrane protein assembly factor BamB